MSTRVIITAKQAQKVIVMKRVTKKVLCKTEKFINLFDRVKDC